MEKTTFAPGERPLSQEELQSRTVELVRNLEAGYVPGRDRIVTPENVFQPAVMEGRNVLEDFVAGLLLPGSRVEGVEHLENCLERLRDGKTVLFLAEHRGNLDSPTFTTLLRKEGGKYEEIINRLVYIAGRKLNESSEFIKMFTEKYSRLILVPRRDYPPESPDESEADAAARAEFAAYATRLNRAAFRQLVRLRKAGYIFVLFPLGGRIKPGADNLPIRETASYLRAFDVAYLISMEGNLLPPLDRMEDERPEQARVLFRAGPALVCKEFLQDLRRRYEQGGEAGGEPVNSDYEQFVANSVTAMLANLRLSGCYEPPA